MSEENKLVSKEEVYEEACKLMQKAIDEARNRWRKQHQCGNSRGASAYLKMCSYLTDQLFLWKTAYAKKFGT